jgi:hypothetical protein
MKRILFSNKDSVFNKNAPNKNNEVAESSF